MSACPHTPVRIRRRRVTPPRRRAGAALILVLWMVAALSLLVASLGAASRSELKLVQAQGDMIRAAAVGDAAILLLLRDMTQDVQRRAQADERIVDFEAQAVRVRIFPADGFIDLNAADESLLAALFQYAGGLPAAEARSQAERIKSWREATRSGGESNRFEVADDLLRVPEFDFDLFDRIRGLVTTSSGAQRVNPLAAPIEVLQVLAGGDGALAAEIARRRAAQDPVIDTTGLQHANPHSSAGSLYRLDAIVPRGDGAFVRSVWARIDRSRDGLPWNIVDRAAVRGAWMIGELNGG